MALSFGFTIQVLTFSCLAYLTIMMVGILPNLVTRNTALIRLKQTLCVWMGVGALAMSILKALVMIKIKGQPILPIFDGDQSLMAQFWGLWTEQSIFILLIDVFQLFLCVVLFLVYKNHMFQAEQRSKIV